MKGIDRVRALEKYMERLQPRQRRGFLDSFYVNLINGDAWDLGNEGMGEAIDLLKKYGFKKHAHKLSMGWSHVAEKSFADMTEKLKEMPEIYGMAVRSGEIILPAEQREIQELGVDGLFKRFMDNGNAHYLGMFPENASPALFALEAELVAALNTFDKAIYSEDLPAVRLELGKRADIIELQEAGDDLYTEERRGKDEAMRTGKLEYQVKKATPLEGPRFVVTTTGGYHGFLKYYAEEAARIAPEGANAYLPGNAVIATIKFRGMRSPFCPDHVLKPIDLKDGMYHVIPVQFFNVEVDKSKKYKWAKTSMEVHPDGGRSVTYSVRPRTFADRFRRDE